MFYLLIARARPAPTRRFCGRRSAELATLLDLVALGTVADVVRLDRVNRVLVEQGLRRIRAGFACSPGSRAHVGGRRSAGNAPRRTDLGFVAGPRLNAAGELSGMSIGIALSSH